MTSVVGILAEVMIGSSKVENVSLVLSDSDVMLDFINEINNVAESIAIDENEVLKNTAWSWFKLNGEPGMVYAPEYDIGHNIIVKIPASIICIDDKEVPNHIVTPKTFGLICTMIATASILVQLKEKRERDLSSVKKMLGLMKRRLDLNIEFFVELYADLDSTLNKTRGFISAKDPSEDTNGTQFSIDFHIISLVLNNYSTLITVDTRI